jgi:hypothetical protein
MTTVVEAVEANPRPSPADQLYTLAKRHIDTRDAKIRSLFETIAALKDEVKALKAARTRPARLPKPPSPVTAPEPVTAPVPEPEPAAPPPPVAKPRARRVTKLQ